MGALDQAREHMLAERMRQLKSKAETATDRSVRLHGRESAQPPNPSCSRDRNPRRAPWQDGRRPAHRPSWYHPDSVTAARHRNEASWFERSHGDKKLDASINTAARPI